MGYSIMTPFEDLETRDRMMSFLDKNFMDLEHLAGNKDYINTRGPVIEPAYGSKGKLVIGFDYAPIQFERDYVYQMCTWMAIMDGKKRRFGSKGSKKVPFIIYDGTENIAVVREAGEIDKKFEGTVVDETGFYELRKEDFFSNPLKIREMNNLFRNELNRLTRLYKELRGEK